MSTAFRLNQRRQGIEEMGRELEDARRRTPGFEELFDLYLDCFRIQYSHFPKIRMKTRKPRKDQIEALADGRPLLDAQTLKVDVDAFNRVLSDIVEAVRTRIAAQGAGEQTAGEPSGGGHGAGQRADQTAQSRAASQPALIGDRLNELLAYPDLSPNEEASSTFLQNLLSFNTSYFTQLAERLSLNPEILLFVTFLSMTPFLEKASLPLRDRFDYETWGRGFCPICGRKPSMAKIRVEDGRKILQCSMCRSWWPYPAAKCTVCGNEDGQTLGFLHAKDDPARHADLCDKCKKYMKTVDCRKLGSDVNLEIEDLATVYLDLAAKEREYDSAGRMIYAYKIE